MDYQFILSYHGIDSWTNLEGLPVLELEYMLTKLKAQKEMEKGEDKENALVGLAAKFEHVKRMSGKDPIQAKQEEKAGNRVRERKPKERIMERRAKLAEASRKLAQEQQKLRGK